VTPSRPLEKHARRWSASPPNRPRSTTGKMGNGAKMLLRPNEARESKDWPTEGLIAAFGTHRVRGEKGQAR
jgi:hypothetical protein